MKERFAILVILALIVSISAPAAHAGLVLKLQSGSEELTIVDSDLDGVVSFSGAIAGTNWAVNVTTGISKPVFGPNPKMDLNSVNVSTSAAGMLTIMLTDTDFVLPDSWNGTGQLWSSIGGTTNGTIALTQTLDPDNSEFAVTDPGNDVVAISGPFSNVPVPSFSETKIVGFTGITGPFSLTEVVTITHTGAGSTSFDAESLVVPVPAAMLLGVLGLGTAGLRLRKRK